MVWIPLFFSHNLISDVAIKKFKFNNSSQDKKRINVIAEIGLVKSRLQNTKFKQMPELFEFGNLKKKKEKILDIWLAEYNIFIFKFQNKIIHAD